MKPRRRAAMAGAVLAFAVGIAGAGEAASAPPASAATSPATTITAGATHSCVIHSGAAYCWGDNAVGELGDNSTTSSSTPLAVYAGGALSGVTLTQIATGNALTCALASTGAAYCWGLGTSGQLGNGTTVSSSVPVAVSGSLDLTQISVGSTFACGVTSDGAGHCWGAGGSGQLGNGTATAAQSTPVAVAGSLTLASVDAGGSSACGLSRAGTAYCWGAGGSGQLGDSSTTAAQTTPVAVSGSLTLAQVTVGSGTACGLTSGGAAYCWGAGGSGQLGDSSTTAAQTTPVAVTTAGTPLAGATLGQISAGTSFACALDGASAAYCWGLNSSGQLGDPDTAVSFSVPVAVLSRPSAVAAGYGHSCLLRNGKAYCGGDDTYGELGNNITTGTPRTTPAAVYTAGVLSGVTLTQIAAGQNFSCALSSAGDAYCWGDNGTAGTDTTSLGDGTTTASSVPVLVSGGLTFAEISAGGDYACGVTTAGAAYCWGNNPSGQLGSLTPVVPYAKTPTAVDRAIGTQLHGVTLTQIDAGLSSTCALSSTGAAYCWGLGTSGQLGNSVSASSTTPVAVTTAGTPMAGVALTQLTVGSTSACALGAPGAVYCWGAGGSGQLGNGATPATQNNAVAVTASGVLSGITVTQISAGTSFACVLGSAGAAYCWGLGTSGQLGNSASASSSVPVAVTESGALAGATLLQASSGQLATCAADPTGAIYCWGGNDTGQLGNGTTTGSDSPTAVTGLVPGAPTGVTATPGDTTATIAWTAPSNSGPGTLTGYTATAAPGGFSCSATTATTCVITGLTDGTTYSVTGVTNTTDGDSPPSSPVTVTPVGFLTLTAPASLSWAVTGSGQDQAAVDTSSADQQLTVTDNTLTGAGWHITLSATTFTSGAHALPDTGAVDFAGGASSLATAVPSATCAGACTLPTDSTIYPVAITTATSTPTAYTVYDASAGTGKGTMTIGGGSTADPIGWWVQVPASAYAGSYTSTLTLEIVSAP